MKNLIFTAAVVAWIASPFTITQASAQAHDDHDHAHGAPHETHATSKGHDHEDHTEDTHNKVDSHDGHGHDDDEHGHDKRHEEPNTADDHGHDDHNDHGETSDTHDDHGHETHKGKDDHDDHGHGDEHGGHDEHEEGKTEILPDAAKNAGIKTARVSSETLHNIIPLTGRITLDQNTKADVSARFSGIVRRVKVNLGDHVKKGQVLAVVEANESLQNYNVTAPINGVVLERSTNIGDVANSDPLFMIADLSNVWAKFHIFPKDADMVKAEQSIRVHTLDEKKENVAAIKMLFSTADALSQTLVAIAPISNKNGLWRPGMTVEGDVTISKTQVPLAVHTSAIQTIENQKVVFIKEGNSYEKVPVQTGISDGKFIEIKSGLETGQEYVSEASFIIKADLLKAGAEHNH